MRGRIYYADPSNAGNFLLNFCQKNEKNIIERLSGIQKFARIGQLASLIA